MALHTLGRRSSKYALQVAPLAHNLRMAAAEREAGAAVIDLDIGTACATLGFRFAREHDTEPQDRCDEHGGNHPPFTQRAMRSVRVHRHSNTFTFIRCSTALALPDYCKNYCKNIEIGNIVPLIELHDAAG